MESSESEKDPPPFQSAGIALAFWNNNNPARQRFIDVLQPDRGSSQHFGVDFTGRSPRDIWASVSAGIDEVLAGHSSEARTWWELRNSGDRAGHLSYEAIGTLFRVHPGKVGRVLRKIREELDAEFVRRDLIPKDHYDRDYR